MYDYDKLHTAYKKFLLDFEPDGHIGADMPGPGSSMTSLTTSYIPGPAMGSRLSSHTSATKANT